MAMAVKKEPREGGGKEFWILKRLSNKYYLQCRWCYVMFAGHLGENELAGSTLANSWATVTGFASMAGLSGALETLCGQGFGAKKYRMLGIYLQASCIISFLFSVVISILWLHSEQIVVLHLKILKLQELHPFI